MPFKAFLRVEGIAGESNDDRHRDWIEILSYNHGLAQSALVSGPGGTPAASRITHQDFRVTKSLDKSSPKLNLACCKGEYFRQITLELCRATGDKQRFMVYTMGDVIVTSIRPAGSAVAAENLPIEEVTFNYRKIEWTYTETDPRTGVVKGDVKASWDVATNQPGRISRPEPS